MAVSVQNFVTLVENQVAAAQGFCKTLIDFTIGSILRALVEANAAQGLFLQAQALQVAALTRAATSQGSDLDSFFADFGFERLAASFSSGNVTFARFTYTAQALLSVGAIVQSFDGSQQFTVLADPTNAAYNASLSAYVVPAGTPGITVLAQSNTAGSAANVAAGTITQIVTSGLSFDSVTNASPFEGGADAETDPAFRARFALWLSSLSKATRTAILYAVNSVQAGLSQSLVENTTYSGTATSGYFYDVVDDGSGSPPSSLLSAVSTAIDNTRALGISFSVFTPTTITANVGMTIATASGYTHSAVTALVQAALTTYIHSLGLGVGLSYSRLAQVAYDASSGVTNVTAITLDGGTADLAATNQQRITAGVMTVS
jgi:uncharacterized phage protein gp47/JayE